MTLDPAQCLDVDVRLALDSFQLEVSIRTSHKVTGIFGPSGSGKTSLLETIAGLRRRALGRVALGAQVFLDSRAGVRLGPERRRIGYVPQDGLLFPTQSVRGNLLAGRRRALRRGLSLEPVFGAVTELLELEPLLERSVQGLSGGERQRVALGRAICSGPSLLLLDEPLAALDLPLRRRLLPFLRRLHQEFEIPSILVSHDPVEVQALCDDLIVLHEGKLVARGAPARLLADPEVYALAEHGGFENLLSCTFVDSSEGTCRVRILDTEPALEFTTSMALGRSGERALLGLPAHEIMIATERPRGLSARNVLPSTVVELRHTHSAELVTLSLGAGASHLTAEVTSTTVESLGLVPGAAVFAVFKATSCRLHAQQLGG